MDVKRRSHQISSPGRIKSREEGRNQVCSVQCLILLTEEEILLNNGISEDDNSPLLFAFDLGSFFPRPLYWFHSAANNVELVSLPCKPASFSETLIPLRMHTKGSAKEETITGRIVHLKIQAEVCCCLLIPALCCDTLGGEKNIKKL